MLQIYDLPNCESLCVKIVNLYRLNSCTSFDEIGYRGSWSSGLNALTYYAR